MIARANAHAERKFSDIPYRFSPWRARYRAGEQACRDFHTIIEGIYQAVRYATSQADSNNASCFNHMWSSYSNSSRMK